MKSHDKVSRPHSTSNPPALSRRHSVTPPFSRSFRNRPRGVKFISPSKPKCTGSRLSDQEKTSISSEVKGSPKVSECLNSKFKQSPTEACTGDTHTPEMEMDVSEQVNPLSYTEGGRTLTQLTQEVGHAGSSDLLVTKEDNDSRTDIEKMKKLRGVAHSGGGSVQDRVVTYCPGVAKIASSEDLNHFHSNGSSKLGVRRKLPPTIMNTHSSLGTRATAITPSLRSEPQTQLERYFSPAVPENTHVQGENTGLLRNLTTTDLQSPDVFNPLPQAAHLTVASPVSEPEPSSRTEAHVIDVESPLPSMWSSSEETKRLIQHLDAKGKEILTSAGQTLAITLVVMHIFSVLNTYFVSDMTGQVQVAL